MGIIYCVRASETDHQMKGNLKLKILNGGSSIFACFFAYRRLTGVYQAVSAFKI
jgi:hypothetical protein